MSSHDILASLTCFGFFGAGLAVGIYWQAKRTIAKLKIYEYPQGDPLKISFHDGRKQARFKNKTIANPFAGTECGHFTKCIFTNQCRGFVNATFDDCTFIDCDLLMDGCFLRQCHYTNTNIESLPFQYRQKQHDRIGIKSCMLENQEMKERRINE